MPNQRRAPTNPDGTCSRCGEVHTKCAAHRKRDGKPCTQSPRAGGVCRMHGGSASQTLAAERHRLAADEATRATRRLFDQYEIEPIGDPLEHFQRVLAEVETFKAFLADRVADLGDQLTAESNDGYEHLRAVLVAYERALDRSAKFTAVMIRLNIEERLLTVREQHVRLLESALLATLAQLGVRVDDEAVRTTLATNLRLIDGGAAA